MTDTLLISTSDGIRTLTLNRPERRNALSAELQAALHGALRDAAVDSAVRCVVLTGTGDKAFCSGGDLQQMGMEEGWLAVHDGRFGFAELLLGMLDFNKPLVARVGGNVLAGGVGLVLACDLVIAADDVTVSTPELQRGLFPMMISALMVRELGRKRATELILLGDKWSAQQAREAGMVNFVVPRAALDDKTSEVASKLAAASPAVMGLGKKALRVSSEMGLREALAFLHSQLSINLMTEDAMEGIAAFLEKRPPQWKGR
ncbi:MAG: enoyl-CoA hydratase/isomerase family protein [Deltaproteobacteria bacterium]|nr:enoyl-CoA hydratase/isomerase family protein [Deltaproteobacteria bacterium]